MAASIHSRFGGSKVRSGCLTCKARHVKCDEKKPLCDRCSKAGRNCAGYASPSANRRRLGGNLIMINYVAPSNGPRLSPTADAQEQRSFDYFRSRTVPELASSFASELWSRFILQTAHHEPAIRYAITALGSLHEHFESGEDAHALHSDFGFQQYIKAIQCVVKGPTPFAGQSTDVALISCILFTAFESLQGNLRSALTHISSGLKVLAEREASGHLHPGSYIPKEFLKCLFTRFDSQALEIGDLAFRPWGTIASESTLATPSTFLTLEEAERAFDRYYNHLMHFLQSAEVTDDDGRPVTDYALYALKVQHSNRVREYEAWCAAFDNYLALHLTDHPSPTSVLRGQPHPGVLILQIWRIVVRIMLHVDLSVGELVFDTFTEELQSIAELAESFMKQTAAPSRTSKVSHRASLTSVERPSFPDRRAQPLQLNTHPRSWLGSCASHGFLGIQPKGTPCVPVATAPFRARSTAGAKADSSLRPTCLPSTETSVTGLASTTAPTNTAPTPPTNLKPTFSLSLGLISPLYVTVTRCRDPIIRRRALHLLYTCNRREGVWDSYLAALVAHRIVQVEEAGAIPLPGQGGAGGRDAGLVTSAHQIPEHARIRELEVSFITDRKGFIRYAKSVGGGISRPDPTGYYEEMLEW